MSQKARSLLNCVFEKKYQKSQSAKNTQRGPFGSQKRLHLTEIITRTQIGRFLIV